MLYIDSDATVIVYGGPLLGDVLKLIINRLVLIGERVFLK